eukprot:Lankesteria_metandrocarpae@DN1070_c0_g1_i1.p1
MKIPPACANRDGTQQHLVHPNERVRGAIILSGDLRHCLMIQHGGSSYWFFPGGKLKDGQDDCDCARRQVMKCLGVDVGPHLSSQLFIERVMGCRNVKLYIVVINDIYDSLSHSISLHARKRRMGIRRARWTELSLLPGWTANCTVPSELVDMQYLRNIVCKRSSLFYGDLNHILTPLYWGSPIFRQQCCFDANVHINDDHFPDETNFERETHSFHHDRGFFNCIYQQQDACNFLTESQVYDKRSRTRYSPWNVIPFIPPLAGFVAGLKYVGKQR